MVLATISVGTMKMLELYVKVVFLYVAKLYYNKLYFIVCGALYNPVNGGVRNTGRAVGDTTTYYCDYGYDLIGDVTVRCQLSGNWSGSPPTCEG